MTDSITPPPELVRRLHSRFHAGDTLEDLGAIAFQAGADMELEATDAWIRTNLKGMLRPANRIADDLRAARRPKPLSLKQQALEELENMVKAAKDFGFGGTDPTAIRRVLEQLDD